MAYFDTAIMRGTLADRPTDNSAITAGRLYFRTDGDQQIYRDNGTGWDDVTPAGGSAYSIGTWTAPTLNADWESPGAPIEYTKDSNGWVHLRGTLYDGNEVGGAAFTLPVGFRPSGQVVVPASIGTSTLVVAVVVATTGVVSLLGAHSTYVTLNLSFYVG